MAEVRETPAPAAESDRPLPMEPPWSDGAARTAGSSVPERLRARYAARHESLALALAGAAALLGVPVGALGLHGTSPLFGRGSIGETAAYGALGAAGFAFAITMAVVSPVLHPWFTRLHAVRRAMNVLGLALLHAVFAFLLIQAMFAVFGDAFRGAALDKWAGTFWVAISCGATAYLCAASAMALTTQSLSLLLAAFMPTGALASALSATDPHWWQHHFSVLATASDVSGLTFTVTLLLAALALISVGDFLGHDLRTWALATGEPRWKVGAVQIALVTLGALLAVVALIPVNVDRTWHDAAAQSIVLVFAIALVAVPILFHRMPGSFQVVTMVVFALLAVCLVLYKGVDYLNTTAFEMGAGAIVFTWLLLFVRTVSAAVRSLEG